MESKQAVAEKRTEPPADDALDDARPMRADARRNRERLVSAAREVFAEQGSSVSMEAIAKHAGVGIGTLYRHFPNRFDIVEAVYRDDVEELVRAAERARRTSSPGRRSRPSSRPSCATPRRSRCSSASCSRDSRRTPSCAHGCASGSTIAFDLVVERAKAAGVVRHDVTGSDLTQLVSPICTNASIPDEQMRRLINMILDGLPRHGVSLGPLAPDDLRRPTGGLSPTDAAPPFPTRAITGTSRAIAR